MMLRTPFILTLPALGIPLLVACSTDASVADASVPSNSLGSGVMRTDSAGIVIVDNQTPAWPDGQGWTVDAEPALEIGVVEGEQPYLFSLIVGALRLRDGRIVIADMQSREIRIFDPAGVHLVTIGGIGEAPGEFATTPAIGLAEPDTILAWDRRAARLSWFTADGVHVRDVIVPDKQSADEGAPFFAASSAYEVGPNGVLGAAHIRQSHDPTREGIIVDTIYVLARRLDGTVTTVGPIEGNERYQRPPPRGVTVPGRATVPLVIPNPLYTTPHGALWRDPYPYTFAGMNGTWELSQFGVDGSLRRIIRAAVQRMPITAETIDSVAPFFDYFAEMYRMPVSDILSIFGEFPQADSMAATVGLRFDSDGNAWVERRDLSTDTRAAEFDVIDPDGRWLGTVRIPGLASVERSRVLHIDGAFVLASVRDDLGVSYLRLYRIRRPGE